MFILKRIYSWLLAIGYLCGGLSLFFFVPAMEAVFSGRGGVPFLLRALFTLGSWGCFILMAAVATLLILNELRYRRRFISPVFSIVLLALTCQLATVVIIEFDFH